MIRALSARTEFLLVVLVAFGYFIFASVLTLFYPSPQPPISEGGLQFLLFYEICIITLLWSFLRYRGWSLRGLGLVPSGRDTLYGFGLTAAVYAFNIGIWLFASVVANTAAQEAARVELVAPHLNLLTVVLVSLLNPLFEELFVCGYVISAVAARRDVPTAINVSVAIRLAYHLYQGPIAVLTIIPVGLLFAIWYTRTRRLWPVVVSHGVLDLLALIGFTGS